jgi:hypothetical protein
MKYISSLIVMLILICHSQCYSQKFSGFQYALFKKKHPFEVKDLKQVQKDGNTSWTVRATLTNRSKDTLFYFSSTCSEPANYMIDTMALFVDVKCCDTDQQTVIAIPPRGQRTVDLEISAHKSVTSSIPFRIFFIIYKAKNINERVPMNQLLQHTKGGILLVSDQIKT